VQGGSHCNRLPCQAATPRVALHNCTVPRPATTTPPAPARHPLLADAFASPSWLLLHYLFLVLKGEHNLGLLVGGGPFILDTWCVTDHRTLNWCHFSPRGVPHALHLHKKWWVSVLGASCQRALLYAKLTRCKIPGKSLFLTSATF
jgi:hypothetical protein